MYKQTFLSTDETKPILNYRKYTVKEFLSQHASKITDFDFLKYAEEDFAVGGPAVMTSFLSSSDLAASKHFRKKTQTDIFLIPPMGTTASFFLDTGLSMTTHVHISRSGWSQNRPSPFYFKHLCASVYPDGVYAEEWFIESLKNKIISLNPKKRNEYMNQLRESLSLRHRFLDRVELYKSYGFKADPEIESLVLAVRTLNKIVEKK